MLDLDEGFTKADPFELAKSWLKEAEAAEINDPNAMALASVDRFGRPNVRTVWLKDIEANSFVFYTNYESAKGTELLASGKAAFVLHWKSLAQQIRVRGLVEKEDGPIADAYYNSRALDSRIGAWASQQSRPLESKEALEREVARYEEQFGNGEIPPRRTGRAFASPPNASNSGRIARIACMSAACSSAMATPGAKGCSIPDKCR